MKEVTLKEVTMLLACMEKVLLKTENEKVCLEKFYLKMILMIPIKEFLMEKVEIQHIQ